MHVCMWLYLGTNTRVRKRYLGFSIREQRIAGVLFGTGLQAGVASRMKSVYSVGLDRSTWGIRSELKGKHRLTPSPSEALPFLTVCTCEFVDSCTVLFLESGGGLPKCRL